MPNLFGLDIAKLVNDSIAQAGGVRSGVLTKILPGTRGVNPSAGTNPSTTTHNFKGFVELRTVRRKGQSVEQTLPVVTILGASVTPVAAPTVNDSVVIDGETYILLEMRKSDPAGAVFEFISEG